MPHYDKSQPSSLSEESLRDASLSDASLREEPLREETAQSDEYCIRICVYADGTFATSGPEPIGEDMAPDAEPLTSINEAMKAAFNIFKSNPVGGDAQAQFDAGLKEESGGLIDA
jgi:hypothetical protein